MLPVDVICLSSMDGEVIPLRIRADNGQDEILVGSVCEILATRESRKIGAETRTFLCRVRCEKYTIILELKFFLRDHSWYMTHPLA